VYSLFFTALLNRISDMQFYAIAFYAGKKASINSAQKIRKYHKINYKLLLRTVLRNAAVENITTKLATESG
jgi:hypothetical protein